MKKVVKSTSFLQHFKEHCEKTLQNKKNVVLSLQSIKTECNKLLATDLLKITE